MKRLRESGENSGNGYPPTHRVRLSPLGSGTSQIPEASADSGEIKVGLPSRAGLDAHAMLPSLTVEMLHEILSRLTVGEVILLERVSTKMQENAVAYLRSKPPGGMHSSRGQEYEVLSCTTLMHVSNQQGRKNAMLLSIDPLKAGSWAEAEAQLAAIEEAASLAASSIGRRFHNIKFRLDEHYDKKIGEALIKADGWSHLELDVVHDLLPFLWRLVSQQAERGQPVRTFGLNFIELNSWGTPEPVGRLLCSVIVDFLVRQSNASCALQLTSLQVSCFNFPDFMRLFASAKKLDRLELVLPASHDEKLDFIDCLSDRPNLKVLSLRLHPKDVFPNGFLTGLIDQVKCLEVEDFALTGVRGREFRCLSDLLTTHTRRLAFIGLYLGDGTLAEFGGKLANSKSINKLCFDRCSFDADALNELTAGVRQSGCLSHLTVTGDVAFFSDALGVPFFEPVQACPSLKTLELGLATDDEDLRAAVAALETARPDLRVQVEWIANAEGSEDSTATSDSDDLGAYLAEPG